MTRRRFLALSAGCGLFGAYAWGIEPHWIEVVRRDLPITALPADLVGRTLVQIGDLHIGPVVDDEYIKSALELASSLEGDILAITGDFVTYHGPEQIDQAARVLEHVRPAPLATLAILGNHDYGRGYLGWGHNGHGWNDGEVADRLAQRLVDVGVDLLRNTWRDVHGLQIVGLEEFLGPNFGPKKVLSELNPNASRLVLCHNPDAVDEPVWGAYQGWILSGHTHGGQCKPPFLDPPIIPVRNKRYTAGAFDLGDGRRMYINRGLGYLRRVRFNARPEITVFTLTRADSSVTHKADDLDSHPFQAPAPA
jgi:predicted MPP superfamily phosphohydrolase